MTAISFVFACGFQAMPEAPPTPPSMSRTLENVARDQKPFWRELIDLFRNWRFNVFLFVFGMRKIFLTFAHITGYNQERDMASVVTGIAVAISGAFLTVFDEVLNQGGYEDYQGKIGYVGFGVQCTAILSLLCTGWWLDRTKSF